MTVVWEVRESCLGSKGKHMFGKGRGTLSLDLLQKGTTRQGNQRDGTINMAVLQGVFSNRVL